MEPSDTSQAVDPGSQIDLTRIDQDSAVAESDTPAAKRLRLSYKEPGSSGSSVGGRKQSTLWPFFTKSAVKQNKSHYTAFCKACTNAGQPSSCTGKSDSMVHHLKICKHVPPGVHTWANQWTDKSEPYTGNAIEDTQSDLSKFMSLKDMPLTEDQQEVFDMLLLKATISANLPFSWIDNPFVKEAFVFLRSVVDLPSRRQLSGESNDCRENMVLINMVLPDMSASLPLMSVHALQTHC